MDIREDRWLSDVLGHEVFSLAGLPEAGGGTGDLADTVRLHARDRGAAMYYARFDSDRIDLVRELGAAGFYVVDLNVVLARARADHSPPLDVTGVAVKDATPEHYAAALDIAERSFRYSRFHLDPLISRTAADRVKREWIRSYVEGRRGERLMLAHGDGQVLGFLAVLASNEEGRRVRTIDLIAVAPHAQGRGVGTALVSSFIERYADCDRLEVGTQAANIPSLALYQRCGFRVARTRMVMHMHTCAR